MPVFNLFIYFNSFIYVFIYFWQHFLTSVHIQLVSECDKQVVKNIS